MKNLLGFLMLALFPVAAYPSTVKIDLSDAIKDKIIKLDAVNILGMYTGKSTRLTITNNTKSVLDIKVNLGVILNPDDSNCQPMVLAGEETLVVMPSSTGDVTVETFCGNSSNLCPRSGLHYSFSRVGSDTLIKILRFIKTNSLFNDLGQEAVWVITNEHRLEDVYDPGNPEIVKKLIELLSKTTGRPRPGYHSFSRIDQIPGEPAYAPKSLKIYADFEVRLEAPKTMTLGVFDSAGKMIQKVFENQEFPAMGHRFGVEFEAENVSAGKYFIRLKEGELVLQEKMVNVD